MPEKNPKKTNKIVYWPGDLVRIQNVLTKESIITRTISSHRITDDGKVLSYNITTDKGYETTRHRRYLRPLAAKHDPKVSKPSEECSDEINLPKNAEAAADVTEKNGTM